jgi:hypothetical protein
MMPLLSPILESMLGQSGAIVIILPGAAANSEHGVPTVPQPPVGPGSLDSLVTALTARATAAATKPEAATGGRPLALEPSTSDQQPCRQRRSASTPGARAQAIYEVEGDVWLDRETWVRRTGVSRRCLDRAIARKLIPTQRSGVGRANRRESARASDVARVLTTLDAVRAGRMAPPDWYDEVVRPRPQSAAA